MANFTQLTNDLAIIAALADLPNTTDGLTASQLKDKFDEASGIIKTFLNSTLISELQSTTDSSSGADRIGATAITNLTGTTVQAILEDLRNILKSTTDNSSGADFVAATAISGLTGTTIQALLESIKSYVDTHKSSSDHDSRYFTEIELSATTDSSSGADKIGATAIGASGATVQAILEYLKTQIDNVQAGSIADDSLTTAKMATSQKREVANGVAGLDANSKVIKEPASKSQANGICPLDSNSKVPLANVPTLTADKLPSDGRIVKLDGATINSNSNSITITVPAGYEELIVNTTLIATTSTSSGLLKITFNNDSTAGNYKYVESSNQSSSNALDNNSSYIPASYVGKSNTNGNDIQIKIINKSARKMVEIIASSDPGQTSRVSGFWKNANALTSIELTINATQIAANSTWELYGINYN